MKPWLPGILLAIGLSATASRAGDPKRDAWKADTRAAIPRLAKAPTIDGTVGKEEWSGAFACDGVLYEMTLNLFPRRVEWRVGWDPDGLYLASRTPRLKGEDPRTEVTERDLRKLSADDSLELFVYRDDRKASLHLVVNPDGVWAATRRGAGKPA